MPGEGAWGSPPPFPQLEGEEGERAPGGRAVVVPALASLEPPPGGSGEYEEGAFVWLPLWRLSSAAPGWGKGVVVWAENPPPHSFPELGLRGPRG